ncbi:MAG: hypothetical protein GXP25_18475 [Planctomycetes bacterium]|nr:hypothetical protein [Planctomycetota bacterium]
MKYLLIFSCLLICASAFAQNAPGKVSPLKEWSIVGGEWEKTKNGARCRTGRCNLQWNGEIKKRIEIRFYLTISEWPGDGAHEAGITWDGGDAPDSRNAALVSPAHIRIFNNLKPHATHAVRFAMPLKKAIPVKAVITAKGVQIVVGKEKVSSTLPSQKLDRLRLWVGGADATFSKVKVKSK